MNDAPSVQANAIRRQLAQHRIIVLAVTEPYADPEWFTVYLHRSAGNCDEPRTAAWVLTRMAGVREVRVDEETPMIVRVRYVLD